MKNVFKKNAAAGSSNMSSSWGLTWVVAIKLVLAKLTPLTVQLHQMMFFYLITFLIALQPICCVISYTLGYSVGHIAIDGHIFPVKNG